MSTTYENDVMIDILYSMKENIRRKILSIIFMAGEGGVSFKTIVQEGKIPPTTAAYHLKKLTKAGLVMKEFRNIDERRDYSFYNLTGRGDKAYFMIKEIFSDMDQTDDDTDNISLPDIQVIPLRIGPRCVSIERMEG